MENPIKMDDLGVPFFFFGNTHIRCWLERRLLNICLFSCGIVHLLVSHSKKNGGYLGIHVYLRSEAKPLLSYQPTLLPHDGSMGRLYSYPLINLPNKNQPFM